MRPVDALPGCIVASLLALALGFGGCRGTDRETMKEADASADTRTYLLETVGEVAVARLYADGFEELTPRERVLAFYLWRAAIAGRDIYYDQMGASNLEIRDLLEEILTHGDQVPAEILQPLHTYLKLFWIHNGNHNDRTKRKFLPEFSAVQLRMAAQQAVRNGARIRLALGESLDDKLARLKPILFDPHVDPLLTCKTPPPGQDILECSSVNYYEGVTLAETRAFRERHPLNSRLVKRDGRLQEEVYRSGLGDVQPGRYASDLRTVTGFLKKARPHAEPPQQQILDQLIEFFATGDPAAFERHNIAWVRHDLRVDTVNGFIETYKDPRSAKGAYEGLVYFVDLPMTRMQQTLAAEAQYFENRAPWADAYKRQGFTPPIAGAVRLLVAVGDGGPMPPIGVNLPNEESIRERYGNKSVSLVNVMEAGKRASRDRMLDEFVLPEDQELLRRHGGEADLLMTAMHEMLGHAAGRVSASLTGDPASHLREHYAALEEARADLVALYHLFDPRLGEIGAITSPAVAEAAYRDFAAADLYMLRGVRQGDQLEDDHMRAIHLIVSYLREVTGAVGRVERDGRTYQRVRDLEAMRRGVGGLLAEVQRIKGEGDAEAARSLMERFAIRIDPRLRDELVGRAERARIPSYVAFVMPDLLPVRDAAGEVIDARVTYRSDLTEQMLQYAGKRPLERRE